MVHQHTSAAASSSALLAALQKPFAPQEVCLRAGERQQAENGSWLCVAHPMVPYALFKSRLEQLLPRKWGASLSSLVVTGDHLEVTAQVRLGKRLFEGSYTTPFPQATLLTETHELLTVVPDAFKEAFVAACAQFGLGGYLAELAREWVPYDPHRRQLALSAEQQAAHILKLYQQAGLLAASSADPPASRPWESKKDSAPALPVCLSKEALRKKDIAWIRQQCTGREGMLASILQRWRVMNLEMLSDRGRAEVINEIHRANTPQSRAS